MEDKKQIDELAADIYSMLRSDTMSRAMASLLYGKGWGKQSEGMWKKISDKYPQYVCTACNHLYNNKEYKFCPNCGAKMKGM